MYAYTSFVQFAERPVVGPEVDVGSCTAFILNRILNTIILAHVRMQIQNIIAFVIQ